MKKILFLNQQKSLVAQDLNCKFNFSWQIICKRGTKRPIKQNHIYFYKQRRIILWSSSEAIERLRECNKCAPKKLKVTVHFMRNRVVAILQSDSRFIWILSQGTKHTYRLDYVNTKIQARPKLVSQFFFRGIFQGIFLIFRDFSNFPRFFRTFSYISQSYPSSQNHPVFINLNTDCWTYK